MTGFLYRQRRSGAPHLARFSRDVGYHGTRRATVSVLMSLGEPLTFSIFSYFRLSNQLYFKPPTKPSS